MSIANRDSTTTLQKCMGGTLQICMGVSRQQPSRALCLKWPSSYQQCPVVVVLLWMWLPVEFDTSEIVSGDRWRYRALITLLGLWSGLLIGFITQYHTSSPYIRVRESLKPRSSPQPQVSSTALLWDISSTIIPVESWLYDPCCLHLPPWTEWRTTRRGRSSTQSRRVRHTVMAPCRRSHVGTRVSLESRMWEQLCRRMWQIGRAVASWTSRVPTTFVTGHGPRIVQVGHHLVDVRRLQGPHWLPPRDAPPATFRL